MDTLSIVVLDEIHMACLDKERRSATLRSLVAKLRKYGQDNIKIVAMSATIPKPTSAIKNWLDAELYETNYRPVRLREYILLGKEMMEFPSLNIVTSEIRGIQDLICPLVRCGKSVLVFCNSKAWCERLAKTIASLSPVCESSGRHFSELLLSVNGGATGKIDPLLKQLITHKVAFHHAGLSVEERGAIENAYKQGYCSVLFATTTLCSGVNLPANRVIIRSIEKGGVNREYIDWLLYRQMIGRAGRVGKCESEGDSVLMCSSKKELQFAVEQLIKCPTLCGTNLSFSDDDMRRLTLDSIGNDECTKQTITNFLSIYAGIVMDESVVTSCLQWLNDRKFVSVSQRGLITLTQLGKACIHASFSPDEAVQTFQEIRNAVTNGIILDTDFHLVYLIATPCLLTNDNQWTKFLAIYHTLEPSIRRVADRIGISEKQLTCRLIRGSTSDESKCCRFYSSLILHHLLAEWSVTKLSEQFLLPKGQVQQLQQSAVGRCFCMAQFAKALNWHSLSALLSGLTNRIEFGCSNYDLDELLQLSLLNRDYAKILYNAGIDCMRTLAESDCARIARLFRDNVPFGHIISARNGNTNVFTFVEAAELLIQESRTLLGLKAECFANGSALSNASADDIFDGFEEDLLSAHGVKFVKKKPSSDQYVAYRQLDDGSFVVSPNSHEIHKCSDLKEFKSILALNEDNCFDFSKFNTLYLDIVSWFAGEQSCASNAASINLDNELLYAPTVYKIYEELKLKIQENESSLSFLLDVENTAYAILRQMTCDGIWVNSARYNNCVGQVMSTLQSTFVCNEARGKLKCLRDIIEKMTDGCDNLSQSNDGWRIHCELASTPTKTGRFMLSNPPLQSVPREFRMNEVVFNCRSIFTTSSKDLVFISADYKHLELGVLALVSNNEFLKNLMSQDEKDPFVSVIKHTDPKYIVTRDTAKVLVYSIMYGAGPKLISKYLGVPICDAADFKVKFLDLCKLPQNGGTISEKITRRTVLGHRLLPSSDLNTIVQSNASEIVKVGMVNVRTGLPILRLVHFMHDELIYECSRDQLDTVIPTLRMHLEQTYQNVNFLVKIRCGCSWGELEPI